MGIPGRRPNKMEGWNYFNYFTEIEEYFWKKRGAHLLVSPLDWAIMETWQKAGVPLEAALKGIDKAFESYQRSRRGAASIRYAAFRARTRRASRCASPRRLTRRAGPGAMRRAWCR